MLMTFYSGLLRSILETIATAREQLTLPSNITELAFLVASISVKDNIFTGTKMSH